MPPPAEGLASRLFLGPALRTQPDRRLVTLVREGYEAAFEEIVRRYGRPLGRYAASIVGGRSEDVLQDAFAKALPALQRDDAEIDLRPWLFRIVRNTALNDLRDSPPSAELLAETLAGGRNPSEELEQREQLADLINRLQELPESQRAAIVMRELEGLGHDEIAAALGLTDGGARQTIHRARRALRDGTGMLLPLPFVRMLIDHGAETAAGAGAGGALAAAGASAGGAGAGGALKVGVVAAVLAGSVGAGVAVQDHRDGGAETARANPVAPDPSPSSRSSRPASQPTADAISGSEPVAARHGEDRRRSSQGDQRHGTGHGGPGPSDGGGSDRHGGPGPAHRGERHEGRRRDGPRGEHRGGRNDGHPEDDLGRHEGEPGPDRHGGHSGPGRGGGDGEQITEDRHGGSGDGGEDPSGSGDDGGGGEIRSGGGPGPSPPPPPPEELEQESSAGEELRDLEE